MPKISRQNVGGTDYTMVGCTLTGTCSSAASDYIKSVTLTDGDQIADGMIVVVAFTNGNTAGTAPAVKTIYSSDQVDYYEDSGLTVPFTLAPSGCYTIEYTGTGNAYTYQSYPVMQIGSVSGPLCYATGQKASGALWSAGDKVYVLYTGGSFLLYTQALVDSNLGIDLFSYYQIPTTIKYGTKVVKTALASSTEGTIVDIQDVLALFGIISGYYSLKVTFVDRSNDGSLVCEYIVAYNSSGGMSVKILEQSDLGSYVRPINPTATSLTLESNQPSAAVMATFEPLAYY